MKYKIQFLETIVRCFSVSPVVTIPAASTRRNTPINVPGNDLDFVKANDTLLNFRMPH